MPGRDAREISMRGRKEKAREFPGPFFCRTAARRYFMPESAFW